MEDHQRTTPLMAEVQPEIRTAPKLEDRSHTLPDQTRTAQQGASHGTGETTQGQLSGVDAELEEERWFEAQVVEAERLRLEAQAEREKARRQADQRISFTDSLAYHLNSLSDLFVTKKPGATAHSRSSNPPPLSLHSRPPSQRSRPAPTASLLPGDALLESSVGSQRFVDHLVVPGDDLVDLAVRYDTSVELIRRHNRRVVFEQLDNVLNEVLHIPVKDSFQPSTPAPSSPAPDTFAAPGIEV